MEMSGGGSAPYLACTPCVPLFCTSFKKWVETEELLDYQERAGDHVHCTGGTFAQSYSVSMKVPGIFQRGKFFYFQLELSSFLAYS